MLPFLDPIREEAGAPMRLAFEWRSINSEITITILLSQWSAFLLIISAYSTSSAVHHSFIPFGYF